MGICGEGDEHFLENQDLNNGVGEEYQVVWNFIQPCLGVLFAFRSEAWQVSYNGIRVLQPGMRIRFL